jgi:hypothetical protein
VFQFSKRPILPITPGFGRANLITLGASEYALVSAILAGFWNVSGVRDGQTGNSSRYVGLAEEICDGCFAENSTAENHIYSNPFEFKCLQNFYREFEFYSPRQRVNLFIINNLDNGNLPDFRGNSA